MRVSLLERALSHIIVQESVSGSVETLKSEKQTVYPKAGLILRSSSFKGTNGDAEIVTPDSSQGIV